MSTDFLNEILCPCTKSVLKERFYISSLLDMNSAVGISFIKKPTIYHSSGLKLTGRNIPCPKELINELLQDIFVTWNRPYPHVCNKLCRQSTQLHLGYPYTVDVKSACSDRCEEVVMNFEDAMTQVLGDADVWDKDQIELQSCIIRFFPCVSFLEVVDAALYL